MGLSRQVTVEQVVVNLRGDTVDCFRMPQGWQQDYARYLENIFFDAHVKQYEIYIKTKGYKK
jgi:hypothetical protein